MLTRVAERLMLRWYEDCRMTLSLRQKTPGKAPSWVASFLITSINLFPAAFRLSRVNRAVGPDTVITPKKIPLDVVSGAAHEAVKGSLIPCV